MGVSNATLAPADAPRLSSRSMSHNHGSQPLQSLNGTPNPTLPYPSACPLECLRFIAGAIVPTLGTGNRPTTCLLTITSRKSRKWAGPTPRTVWRAFSKQPWKRQRRQRQSGKVAIPRGIDETNLVLLRACCWCFGSSDC